MPGNQVHSRNGTAGAQLQNLANAIVDYLTRHRNEILGYLRELILVESPSSEPESQKSVFEILARPLREMDYETVHFAGRTSGGQFYARPNDREKAAPYQILLGHADTVWPLGTLRSMPFRIDGNTVSGPGVYDMKGGLVQFIWGLKSLHVLGVKPLVTPVIFVSSDEELGSEESRNRIELLARRANRVLVPEPSAGPTGKLKTTRKGVSVYQITVRGKSAHAGVEPEAGRSAILEAAHIIQKLHSLNENAHGTTVNVGLVEGGSCVNVVPELCTAQVDVRVSTLSDGKRLDNEIRNMRPLQDQVRIEITGGLDRPPMEETPRNEALWAVASKLGHELGLTLEKSHSGGGSDGNLTSPYTATLDGLGSIGGGAHAPHEFILADSLIERTALMALLINAPHVEV